MSYLLDTVVISELRKRDRNPGVARWIALQRSSDLFLSVLTIGEIEKGIGLELAPEGRGGRGAPSARIFSGRG